MSRFFFHVYDDLDVPDLEGLDLPDAEAARREAIRNARALACEQISKGHLHLAHRIDIEDEAGEVVASVTFAEAFEVER
jgi:hypothetical protein